MLKLITTATAALALSGCFSLREPTVEATKSWEGRYTTLEEASKALDKAATTENDLQVWVLQPSTLNRLLRNVTR